jgi:hypothetical protein
MKSHVLFLCFMFLLARSSFSQDFDYGKITNADVNLKSTGLDSNASAVVIREFGMSTIQLDDYNGRLYLHFKYHVKIKILNKDGFKHGTIMIPRRIYRDNEVELSELVATTNNYTGGKLEKYDLEKKNVFEEKANKYNMLCKFTMPNLKEGSIIEYSYTLRIPDIFNFKGWDFQSDIPKLYSEYVAYIPALYNYNASIRGFLKLTSNKGVVSKDCFRMNGRSYDCSMMTYIMRDIPPFVEEEYMTAASNFRSAIYYELSDYIMEGGGKKSFSKTWKDVDYELMDDKSFGSQMKQKSLFEGLLPGILKNAVDSMSKAEAIYAYISKSIKHNNTRGVWSENGIKKAIETHSGNIGDINLALIACLNAANLDVEALILSTRENGTVNSLYPVITEFDYVVAKLNIGGNSYLLDASQPNLPFGLLPLYCINGKGRAIAFRKPSYWYDVKASQRDMTMYLLDAELTREGTIKGTLTSSSTGYAAVDKRNQIAASNSVDEYVEKLGGRMPSIHILKHRIENTDSLDQPLREIYEIEVKVFDNMNAEQLYYNPFFIDRITKNPFNLNERIYPVDFGSARDVRITASIRLPDDFTMADKPKDLSMTLAGSGGKFLFRSSQENKSLLYSQLFQLSKPVYSSEDYLSLKEFYSRIIQLQKTDIILKKSK